MAPFSARDLALHSARICQDKGGTDLRVLAMPPGAALCDYVVIVTARSDRQTRAIVDEVYHFCKRHRVDHLPVEGDTGWMLIDCFGVVVHALGPEQREHYALDSLWKTARDVDVDAALKGLADPDAARKAAAVAAARPPVADDDDDDDDDSADVDEAPAEPAEAAADPDDGEAAVEEPAPAPAPRRRRAPAKKTAAPVAASLADEIPPPAPRRRARARKAAGGAAPASGDDQ